MMTQIREYVLDGIISKGGFGTVYKAHHPRFQVFFAIKLMHISETSNYKAYSQESQILCNINHPLIEKLYDFFIEDEYYVLVFEYLPNSLQNELDSKPTEKRLSELCSQIIDAIGYLHENKIAHRDIKPGNILIDASGRIRIIDFGIATMACKNDLVNEYGGSVQYCSPEVLGKKPYNPYQSDIWSIGVLICEMFQGFIPWKSDIECIIIDRISNILFELSTCIPRKIRNIIMRIFVIDPGKRPSIEELKCVFTMRRTSINNISLPSLSPSNSTHRKPTLVKSWTRMSRSTTYGKVRHTLLL
ncbi:Aurora kinase C [Tritrichomonas foetus]|uniref:Aurora kinase C n=1 Tax=Tritrichomonas foetus TaxID=1144522 RepID=A0A1J4KKU6_9EUKA|nr:Aurora kinase C [Tritrichomonas foetus]|eukprot:OHT11851.1 Aurora kinase C [Tritrichomonas foetus]